MVERKKDYIKQKNNLYEKGRTLLPILKPDKKVLKTRRENMKRK